MEDKGRGTDDKDTAAQGRFGSIPLGRRAFVKGVLLTGALAVPAVQTFAMASTAYAEDDSTIADDTTSTSSTSMPTKPTKPTRPTKPTTPPTEDPGTSSSSSTEDPGTSSSTTTEAPTSSTTTEAPTSSTTTEVPTTSTTTKPPVKPSTTALPRTGDDAAHVAVAGAGLAGLTLAALGAVLDAHEDGED